jgi:two-component system response regulator PilR (NtrC family)
VEDLRLPASDQTVENPLDGIAEEFDPDGGESLEAFLEGIERKALVRALELERWNRTAAAKRLGMSFRQIRYRLKKLGID